MRSSMTNDILQHVPGRFQRVASTHGGEWAGPCPWCYGRDRFRIWPYREPHEVVYWCRGCGAFGDLIQFLRDAKGMSFQQACLEAGQLPRGRGKEKALDLFKARTRSFPLEPEQLTMLETLQLIEHRMQAAILRPRAQAYLAFRRIPLEVAQAEGMGYLPAFSEENRAVYDKHRVLQLWEDSLVTPMPSPFGMSYTARSLRLWTPGMDEETHKAVLKQQKLPRVLKTGHAGWLWRPSELGRAVIMVEGKFEKLALVAAGMASKDIIAVGSIAANIDWLPPGVWAVLVAFNSDERGQEGAKRFAVELTYAGIRVTNCAPPLDEQGTDCSARWRIAGKAGLRYLFEAWECIQQSLPLEGTSGTGGQPVVQEPPDACADCHTSLEVDDGREFFFVDLTATTAVCYCSRCRDQQGVPLRSVQSSRGALPSVDFV